MKKSDLESFLYGDGPLRPASGILLVAPVAFAIYEAERIFYGRNWRRIKREVRKAEKRSMRAQPRAGIDRSSMSFWRSADYSAVA